MIAIVDYGMGNLGSIKNMFKKIGAQSEIMSRPDEIAKASKILLPGVGAFDTAMIKINDSTLREVLDEKALKEKVPVLGICLGMQLLTEKSEEGKQAGLGWIPGEAKKFNFGEELDLKVPHMGWNSVIPAAQSPMTSGFDEDFRFYFVHSYFVKASSESHVMLKTEYGINFHSGICNDNIFGAQFHPEKSHRFGMKLLSNFAAI